MEITPIENMQIEGLDERYIELEYVITIIHFAITLVHSYTKYKR